MRAYLGQAPQGIGRLVAMLDMLDDELRRLGGTPVVSIKLDPQTIRALVHHADFMVLDITTAGQRTIAGRPVEEATNDEVALHQSRLSAYRG